MWPHVLVGKYITLCDGVDLGDFGELPAHFLLDNMFGCRYWWPWIGLGSQILKSPISFGLRFQCKWLDGIWNQNEIHFHMLIGCPLSGTLKFKTRRLIEVEKGGVCSWSWGKGRLPLSWGAISPNLSSFVVDVASTSKKDWHSMSSSVVVASSTNNKG